MDVSEAFDTIKHDLLTLLTPRIPESYIKIKINLNFHFHISLWCLERFYEGKAFEAPQRSAKIKI